MAWSFWFFFLLSISLSDGPRFDFTFSCTTLHESHSVCMNLILKLSIGKGVLSTQDRYLNLYKYQTSAVGNSFKDFLLLSVAINC